MLEKYFVSVADNRPTMEPPKTNGDMNTTEPERCGEPLPYAMKLLRSAEIGESDLPWTGAVFGLFISHVWYWCTDQKIVQVSLASKDVIHAKGGTILLSYLKLLPLWIMVFPGMAARVLFPNEVACADPDTCQNLCSSRYYRLILFTGDTRKLEVHFRHGCTNLAYIKLITEDLPVGARGLMVAVLLAALMTSLNSLFNSSSVIFTVDIYKRIRYRFSLLATSHQFIT